MLVYEVSECLHLYLTHHLIYWKPSAIAACDVLQEGGITTPLKEKPQEIKDGRNHILAFCVKWYSVAHLLCLVWCD